MRFAIYGCLVMALFCGVAQAEGQGQEGTIMGRFNCRPEVPCDLADAFYSDSEKIFSIGNSCVNRNLSISVPTDGFFDQSAGLDNNGCLTSSMEAFPETNGSRGAPQCCIITLSSGNCALHCDVITQ